LSKISRVNNLKFETTEYDAFESKLNVLLVFHCSGVFFMIATGSEIITKYCSPMLFHSLSVVFKITLYSHSFGSITLIAHGTLSHCLLNLNQSLDVISRS
jgi:hypothetical protein